MTAVTIKNKSGVTFTFQNGDMKGIQPDIQSQPDISPLPGSPPANTLIIDLGGVQKKLTITGALSLATSSRTDTGSVTTILEQKQWLEELQDGAQTPLDFTSNYDSQSLSSSGYTQTKIVITRVFFDEQHGNPNELPFTIVGIVGIG